MRGSYLAEIVEGEIRREKRLKEVYQRKRLKQKCNNCKNKTTELCNVTQDIEGNLKCVNYEVEQNT